MGQYYFARWRLFSVVVFYNAAGRRERGRSAAPAAGRVDGRAADTTWRANTVTSGYGDTLLNLWKEIFRFTCWNYLRICL